MSGEPQWLDRDESEAWLALVSVLLTLPGELDARLKREAGLTFYEYLVLAALSDSPDGCLRMSGLAVVTNGSLPRLSQVVTKLEQRGWVTRKGDPRDGRCTLAVLTKAGGRKVVEAAPGHVDAVRRLVFDPLTRTQVHQLRTLHERIRSVVAPDNPLLSHAG
ncbi:MAG: MarR family winged helix-turn-helix transcriptional regulator [Acidimicrobiales bacterium]